MKKTITLLAIVVCLNTNAQICFTPASGSPHAGCLNPYTVISADFNGDGFADLAAADNGSASVRILLGTGTGTFGSVTNYTAGSNSGSTTRSVICADFNGDGKLDLATANYSSNNVSILFGT